MADTADVIADFAKKVGIDPQQARDGLAALLQAIQQVTSPETFERIVQQIPNGPQLLEQAKQQGAGLWGAVAGVAEQMAGLFGAERSQALANLVARLSELGLNGEQMQRFMTQGVEFLRQHLPADLMEQLSNFLNGAPGPAKKPS